MSSLCGTQNIQPIYNFTSSLLQHFSFSFSNDFSYLSFYVIDIRNWSLVHSVLNISSKENPRGVMAGILAAMVSPRPIQRSGHILSSAVRIMETQCDGAPACWKIVQSEKKHISLACPDIKHLSLPAR